MDNIELIKKITELSRNNPAYHRDAYLFVLAALEHMLSKLRVRRHLTGSEFSYGAAEYAREQYGYLAKNVLENWGIKKTSDFGEIVYLLIEKSIMSKTENDRKEDFESVFDFDEEFSWEMSKPIKFPERF